jgi:putative CocE/NonD family hydrolase
VHSLFKFFIIFLTLTILFNQETNAENNDLIEDNYILEKDVLIKTRDGALISAMIVRGKSMTTPQPVLFQYTVYVRDTGRDLASLKEVVDKGYIAVIAYTRGKRFSPSEIWPYEHDGNDAYDVINWISKQSWSNGQVGMFGGSYNGFTQWAAVKTLHPALKTIVPYVANRPGMGLPMENNVFINPNYEWSFYVASNKYLNNKVGDDRRRFRKMQNKWWDTGAAYKTMDKIDGTPNRLFQKWIKHPSFDKYWQDMAPYKDDFSQITIPVLSIDGYYNDSQNSGLYYLREHYKYNPKAEHYLIIGPYSHFGAQRKGNAVLNGYEVDKDALIDTKAITYQWLDYILKDGTKPKALKNKINYQVMGANEWRSSSSIEAMSNKTLTFYLSKKKFDGFHTLEEKKPLHTAFFSQQVDFSDREISNNNYYPDPIISNDININDGFMFISQPFEKEIIVNGSFKGKIIASINKKDMDIGVTLYEVMPDGKYFHLSYFIGRASYAKDITARNLLQPNTKLTIPFSNTHLVSKKLSKGSRLLVSINVNKNPFSQLNYGTGKEVSEENMSDAKVPLKIKWYNDSFVQIPIWE